MTWPCSEEYLYISGKEREGLCVKFDSSRVILVRPSFFLSVRINEMKRFLLEFYSKHLELNNSTYEFILHDDSKFYTVSQEIFEDNCFLIRDVKRSEAEYYRQLIYKGNPFVVEEEVKLRSVNEKDSKSNFGVVKTNSHIKKQKLRSCIDASVITSLYVKVMSMMILLMDCKKLDTIPIEVLIVGGGTGMLPFFLKSVYHRFIKITVFDRDQNLRKMGEEYLGYGNSDNYWCDPSMFLKSVTKQNAKGAKIKDFDLIILNQTSTYSEESILPSIEAVTKDLLEGYKAVLSKTGALVYQTISWNPTALKSQSKIHEEVFQASYTIENCEGNSKYTIGLKTETSGPSILSNFFQNLNLLSKECSIDYLTNIYEKIANHIKYRSTGKLIDYYKTY